MRKPPNEAYRSSQQINPLTTDEGDCFPYRSGAVFSTPRPIQTPAGAES
jgi:hypothetical protein